ncbi:MAG: chemotaxis protein CheW [Isosphaeraceae bacterium]
MTTRDDCWNRIGTSGDRSCPELVEVIQCRNCSVFSQAATDFFKRRAPEGYLDEWARNLAAPTALKRGDEFSLLVFRLGSEWFALRTRIIVEVTPLRPVHSIPHRSNEVLAGLVNLRGRLHLIVSLHGLIGIDRPNGAGSENASSSGRLVVMRHEGSSWVFAAEEVEGVRRFDRGELRTIPSNLANPVSSFTQSVIVDEGRTIGVLDDARVFSALKETGHE